MPLHFEIGSHYYAQTILLSTADCEGSGSLTLTKQAPLSVWQTPPSQSLHRQSRASVTQQERERQSSFDTVRLKEVKCIH